MINEARKISGREPIIEEQEELMFNSRVTMKMAEAEADVQLEVAEMAGKARAASTSNASTPRW